MTKTPTPIYPAVTPAVGAALDSMTREQLYQLFNLMPTGSPGLYRASDEALRDAARTYIRMGKLTGEQVLAVRYPVTGGDV